MRTWIAVWVVLSGGVPAGADATLPPEVSGRPGEFVVVSLDAPQGTAVCWYAPDVGLSLIPPGLLRDDRTAVCIASRPGTYRLVCVAGSVRDDGSVSLSGPRVCSVRIAEEGPADPLAARLARAYREEPSPARAEELARLAELYRQAVGVARRPEVRTAGELFAVLRAAAEELGLVGKLAGVQAVIRDELRSALPDDPEATFDAATAGAAFGRIAAALEGCQ